MNVVGRGPAGIDPQVGPAQLFQGLRERREAGLSLRIVGGPIHEHADAPHALDLLRARRARPRDGGEGESNDELASGKKRGFGHCYSVMRGHDPRIHLLTKKDGLPGQARQ